MRAGDLLGSEVFDSDRRKLGHVFDIEARQSGPLASEAMGNTLQITRLLAGTSASLSRLGFKRRDVRGPVGLRWLVRRMDGYGFTWDQIAAIEEHRIFLNCPADELDEI